MQFYIQIHPYDQSSPCKRFSDSSKSHLALVSVKTLVPKRYPLFRSLFTIALVFLNLYNGIVQSVFFCLIFLHSILSMTVLGVVAYGCLSLMCRIHLNEYNMISPAYCWSCSGWVLKANEVKKPARRSGKQFQS